MKKLGIIASLLISLSAFGQDGLYYSYKEYKRGKFSDFGNVKKTGHILKKTFVIFEKNGQTNMVKLKKAGAWGYKNGEYTARLNKKGLAYFIENKERQIIMYRRYNPTIKLSTNPACMSLGLEGEMVIINKKNFIQFFKIMNDPIWLKKAKKIKPGYSPSIIFMYAYLKEHSK